MTDRYGLGWAGLLSRTRSHSDRGLFKQSSRLLKRAGDYVSQADFGVSVVQSLLYITQMTNVLQLTGCQFIVYMIECLECVPTLLMRRHKFTSSRHASMHSADLWHPEQVEAGDVERTERL